MQTVQQLSKSEMLVRAKKHYFSLGINDGAAKLCRSNFTFGLAKIHYAQEQLGFEPNGTFISTPDETISRNQVRWKSGYGYGGKLIWGKQNDPFILIDTKPNACGMLVGGLRKMPSPEDIIKNVNKIVKTEIFLDDIKLQWDYKKGNHFIDVFKVDPDSKQIRNLPPYIFIIHGSVPELRAETDKGPGLYYDKSKTLKAMSKTIKTPFGNLYYLDGTDAKEYLNFFMYAKQFAAEKRRRAAQLLFGKFKEISNPMHQGLKNFGEILLGAQDSTDKVNKYFPVALRSDLPTYLVNPLPCLTTEQIEELGFEHRAKKYGLEKFLYNYNTLPHGGGYSLSHISNVLEVSEIDGERYFVCEQENLDAQMVLTSVSETQFTYRGKTIINRIKELNLGTIAAKLIPTFVLKI